MSVKHRVHALTSVARRYMIKETMSKGLLRDPSFLRRESIIFHDIAVRTVRTPKSYSTQGAQDMLYWPYHR